MKSLSWYGEKSDVFYGSQTFVGKKALLRSQAQELVGSFHKSQAAFPGQDALPAQRVKDFGDGHDMHGKMACYLGVGQITGQAVRRIFLHENGEHAAYPGRGGQGAVIDRLDDDFHQVFGKTTDEQCVQALHACAAGSPFVPC